MLDFSKIRVLVTEAGGKQSLAMVRGLKELGCHVTVICSSKLATCYVSNLPDKKFLSRYITKHDERTLRVMLKLVKTGNYDVLMPIGELGTNFVTSHESALSPYVKIACAPRDIYIKAFNKQITFDTAIENDIPCPYTRHSKQNIEDYLENCHFPIIIKPKQGLGSIGFHKFDKKEDFWPYMREMGLDPDDYIVQEFVDFDKHIGCLFFIDQKGTICTAYAVDVLRRFPIDAGSAVLLQTIDAKEIMPYAEKLLHHLGWKGFADVAFMIEKGTNKPKLMEINGRIPQSIKMAFMCGFNISRQMLEMVYDQDVTQYPENKKYGIYLRHFDTDLAWFLTAHNRFHSDPSWFSWKNTQEVLYNKDDILPFLVGFINQIVNFRNKIKRKRH